MEQSANLNLPYIMPSQAQKHVTHNEAIRMLDALVQLGVLDRDLAAPPGDPEEGDRYIVAAGGAQAWSGRDGEIAAWQDGAWAFLLPRAGWLAWIADEERLIVFDGAQWGAVGAETAGVAMLGINATSDATNRLAVGAAAALFTHDGDDHRLIVNKAEASDTASIVFQTGYEGRAEIGLVGDDRFHFKVSEDGETFKTAIVIDEKTGAASFPATPCGMVNMLINGDFAINQRVFAGGARAPNVYGYDRWKAGAGGCNVAVSGGVISHASGPLVQVIESPGLAGVAVTFSVEDLTGGNLNVDIEGETGVIEAGSGRRGVTLTVPVTSTGHVSVTLEPASGGVTYRRAQLNEGVEALPFERRHHATELMLCQRYYQKSYGIGVAPGTANQTSGACRFFAFTQQPSVYFSRMRTVPAATIYRAVNGAPGAVDNLTISDGHSLSAVVVTPVSISQFNFASAPTHGDILAFHYVLDAEL